MCNVDFTYVAKGNEGGCRKCISHSKFHVMGVCATATWSSKLPS